MLAQPFSSFTQQREQAVSDFYTTGAINSISHNGGIYSICPTGAATADNPEYVLARVSSGLFFALFLKSIPLMVS